MAHIYLKEKKDRAMFTSCFKEIVDNHPMSDAHTMMGDAFMSIHGEYELNVRTDIFYNHTFFVP